MPAAAARPREPTTYAVSATVRDAASDLEGVLDVVLAVMDEHRGGMESCILDFENSDGNTAGAFNALTR